MDFLRKKIAFTDAKAAFLLDPRLNQMELELQIDPDFNMVLHHRAFSELVHARLHENRNHVIGMLDADRIKQINSRFGSHWFGNEVLKMFSTSLAEMCRARGNYYLDNFGLPNTTIGCKYGGDEFVFYLPANPGEAKKAVESFRDILQRKIRENSDFLKRTGLSPKEAIALVTFSGGVVSLQGAIRTSDAYKDLFQKISSMTMKAKEEGRNRVKIETITVS
jgi:diguanylate cyclase (GGDEF)-like protein